MVKKALFHIGVLFYTDTLCHSFLYAGPGINLSVGPHTDQRRSSYRIGLALDAPILSSEDTYLPPGEPPYENSGLGELGTGGRELKDSPRLNVDLLFHYNDRLRV